MSEEVNQVMTLYLFVLNIKFSIYFFYIIQTVVSLELHLVKVAEK